MVRKDLIVIGLLLIFGFLSVFLPDTDTFNHIIDSTELLYETNKIGRYVSTDEIAQAIIEKDPSYILIDVRSKEEYEYFTLEGAINIPIENIFDDKNLDYLNQDVYKTVLFSNGSTLADEAWVKLRSYDYHGNKVMQGGLNEWYKTVLNPQKPLPTADATAFDQYLFRKGASLYFTN